MKDPRYLTSVIVVIASIFLVGCGIEEESDQVGDNGAAKNGDAQNGAVEKAAPGNDAAALRAHPKSAEPKQDVPDNNLSAIPEGGLTLENSRLSMSVPKGWTLLPSPVPESNLGMASPRDSIKGHNPVPVLLHFLNNGRKRDPDRVFKSAKRFHERKSNIDSERMQKVAGRDALRLEMTQTDDEGNLTRLIVITIPLDDCTVQVTGRGSPDAMDAVKNQIDEIIDSIKLK